jgi:hypothetical protein
MGSAVSINAEIIAVGTDFAYVNCNPAQSVAIDCATATVKGEWWMSPYPCLKGICFQKLPASQTAFDIKVVEVETKEGVTYYLSGALTDYVDKCNSCCGTTPNLTPSTIPVYIPNGTICPDADGNYIFRFFIPTVGSTQTFTASIYIDGAAGSPATSSAVASPAALLTYALANWAAYGTWTIEDTNVLVLTSTSQSNVALTRALVASDYCLAPTFPVTFDEIIIVGNNGVDRTITLPAPVTAATNVQLAAALSSPVNYFADGTLTTAVAVKVNYNGTGQPKTIKLAGVLKGTWTHAVCS